MYTGERLPSGVVVQHVSSTQQTGQSDRSIRVIYYTIVHYTILYYIIPYYTIHYIHYRH